MYEKNCLQCNKTFSKRTRSSFDQWNRQKFCSKSCSLTAGPFQIGNKFRNKKTRRFRRLKQMRKENYVERFRC